MGREKTVQTDGLNDKPKEVELSAFDHCVYLTVDGSQYCLSLSTITKEPPFYLSSKLFDRFMRRDEMSKDEQIELALDIGEHFAKAGVVPSNRSGKLFKIPEWGRPTGSYVATISAGESRLCPECGANKNQTQVCIKSSRRTRVPNTYRCDPEEGGCGRTYEGITTG